MVKDEVLYGYESVHKWEKHIAKKIKNKNPKEVKSLVGIPYFSGFDENKEKYYMAYVSQTINRKELVGLTGQSRFSCIIIEFWDQHNFQFNDIYERGTQIEYVNSCGQRLNTLMREFGANYSLPENDF
jgi:hypothetical protein